MMDSRSTDILDGIEKFLSNIGYTRVVDRVYFSGNYTPNIDANWVAVGLANYEFHDSIRLSIGFHSPKIEWMLCDFFGKPYVPGAAATHQCAMQELASRFFSYDIGDVSNESISLSLILSDINSMILSYRRRYYSILDIRDYLATRSVASSSFAIRLLALEFIFGDAEKIAIWVSKFEKQYQGMVHFREDIEAFYRYILQRGYFSDIAAW